MKTILVAGATGFIGKYLTYYLLQKGYRVNALTRSEKKSTTTNLFYYKWNIDKWEIDKNAFENVETIINLTGVNIGEKRWTKERKREILDSRVKSINLLYENVKFNDITLKLFISSSAVGYYGAINSSNLYTELSPNGKDFLASVCKEWESAACQFKELSERTIILRKGVIIGKDGGIYKKIAPIAKLGINTAIGTGQQFLPWIEITDLLRLYGFIILNDKIDGIYNAVATEQITMNKFSDVLLESFDKKSCLPNIPKIFVKLLVGKMSVMFLKGLRVSNQKLINSEFIFTYDTISKALFYK